MDDRDEGVDTKEFEDNGNFEEESYSATGIFVSYDTISEKPAMVGRPQFVLVEGDMDDEKIVDEGYEETWEEDNEDCILEGSEGDSFCSEQYELIKSPK